MRIIAEVKSKSQKYDPAIVTKSIHSTINEVTLGFQSEVKRSITAKRLVDTGRLRSSFAAEINAGTGRVGSSVIYSRIHEYGGIIRPVRKKMLAWKQGNRWVFAKQVRIREKRYFRDAIDTFNPKMKLILQNVGADLSYQMGGGQS